MQIAGPFHILIGAYPSTSETIETPVLQGHICAVGFALHSNTADFAITTKGATGTPAQTIFDKTSVSGDAWYYPKPQIHTTAGAAINAQYAQEGVPVFDAIQILVENANDGDEFDVTFLLD